MSLHDEIHEQPIALERLLGESRQVLKLSTELRKRDALYVYLVARGASDHAGQYAKYLMGCLNGLPVALAAPSLFTQYQSPPRLRQGLVIAISQSGVSDDVVAVVEDAKRQGAPTLAITNDGHSPLAHAAEYLLELHAGEERSVAASKTYTAELLAIAMLAAALADDGARFAMLERIPGLVSDALAGEGEIARLAERYRGMDHCIVLGRGYNYSTALELSLKLQELAYTIALPFSPPDFMHGPMALVESDYPVISVLPDGGVFDDGLALIQRLVRERLAEVVVISNRPEAMRLAHHAIPLPSGIPEWISPLVAIVPGQLFAYHLARARGLDADHPRRLAKVTVTR